MSFASQTKKELTSLESSACCQLSELSALMRMNGTLSFSHKTLVVDVQTENAAIARRIYLLLRAQFTFIEISLLVRKKMKLKKNNIYIVRISHGSKMLLETLKIINDDFRMNFHVDHELINCDCCKRAYLRGAFLAGGSINNPETSAYHLEIFSQYEDHNESLNTLLNHFELNSKTLKRKKGYICYIKEAEKISDFLTIIEAFHALLHFEDVRIIRDLRNSANRLTNCDNANISKIVLAAGRQLDNIQLIERTVGLAVLPTRLRSVANLRLLYPELPLNELCQMMTAEKISKSGLNHRFKKLDAIAESIRLGKESDF